MSAGDAHSGDEESAPDPGAAGEQVVRRRVTITNTRGLHARAAAKFAKTAGGFKARITVVKGELTVSGLSIMGLMMLAAAPGSDVELRATGPDAKAAVDALAALVAARFEEDDTET
ncbi:MAG: HPr family phosphocarrier protein [Rhodospirillales bacterium]